jgi:hypothetical protein
LPGQPRVRRHADRETAFRWNAAFDRVGATDGISDAVTRPKTLAQTAGYRRALEGAGLVYDSGLVETLLTTDLREHQGFPYLHALSRRYRDLYQTQWPWRDDCGEDPGFSVHRTFQLLDSAIQP